MPLSTLQKAWKSSQGDRFFSLARSSQQHSRFSKYYLLLLAGLQLTIFSWLVAWVRKQPHTKIDNSIFQRFSHLRPTFRRQSISVLSQIIGEPIWLNISVIPLVALAWKKQLRREAIFMAATSTLTALIRSSLRSLIKRPRPENQQKLAQQHKEKHGFPSGHVTTAVTFWGWVFVIGRALTAKQSASRRIILYLPWGAIAAIGPMRIYIGKHWASDVVGGYLLGGGSLCLSLGLYKLLRK
ncbi:phosphatase PAP2 family protein [Ktedonosporobacter rubrisoli]|uniref:Phosphatase PAP2 family protein n=1 Tax=Ktedonosporobacter rubrisoli TaxID=2509675 RepID=A0A4P6JHU1_KTERU|nr:phosphatase PAP2 family protein [Ktedonosporobacter rubrisoli]QBD74608.1 phosphatase PAP2 family protein [Ktedonosporobacter rubrisoli]